MLQSDVLLLAGIFVVAALAAQQPPPQPMRVLFIGNSFTFGHDLPKLFRGLAEKKGVAVTTRTHAIGGATLADHAANVEVKKLLGQRWDYVVLQEQSQMPSLAAERKKSTTPNLIALKTAAESAGSKVVLFATWGFEKGDRLTLPNDDYEAMQSRLDAGFAELSAKIEVPLVPVGRAWAAARRAHPELPLWSEDGKHPALEGAYLSACVFLAVLARESPRGNAFTGGLPVERARVLQELAAAAVLQ